MALAHVILHERGSKRALRSVLLYDDDLKDIPDHNYCL